MKPIGRIGQPTISAPPRPAAPPPEPTPPEEMPFELQAQFHELKQWATANRKNARRDTLAFWAFKIPAILTAASAGIWAHFELTTVSVFSGAIAGACVIVDGIHPRGMLRNTHIRGYHDIRILSTRMMSEWRSRNTTANDDNTARRIIREAEDERQRIATYIRDAETALKFKQEA